MINVVGGKPPWRLRPVILDTHLKKGLPWAVLPTAGYSNKFEINAPIQVKRIVYGDRPEYLYVTGDGQKSIHTFWFPNDGGTAEFDIIDGGLTHLDSYGCNVSIFGSDLIFSSYAPGAERMRWGPHSEKPRNSEELLISAFYKPE